MEYIGCVDLECVFVYIKNKPHFHKPVCLFDFMLCKMTVLHPWLTASAMLGVPQCVILTKEADYQY